jgi:hypothetical protein
MGLVLPTSNMFGRKFQSTNPKSQSVQLQLKNVRRTIEYPPSKIIVTLWKMLLNHIRIYCANLSSLIDKIVECHRENQTGPGLGKPKIHSAQLNFSSLKDNV